MKENVDELTRLFSEGKHALDQFEKFHSALVPYRSYATMPQMGKDKYGLPTAYYPEPEPEHPKTAEMLQTAQKHVSNWIAEVKTVLDKTGKARYEVQFDDPVWKIGTMTYGETTPNEDKLTEIIQDFDCRLAELRKIIIDYETTSEQTLQNTTQAIEPASYDPKTRTIFFADEAIRFNKNAEYQPAICKLMFEKPEKLWELKDFLTVWDSLYNYLPDIQKPTDWNKVYDAIKKINARVANSTNIADLFKLTTKSVRINPKYITPSKK